MESNRKEYVLELLTSYRSRARQIAVLRYELSAAARISENEMIDTLQFAHHEGAGHTEGHISDKTPSVALNYREKAERLNAEVISEIAAELLDLEKEQQRLEYYVSLMEPRHKKVLRRIYFEGISREKAAEELGLSVRRMQEVRAQAVENLAEMYRFTEALR